MTVIDEISAERQRQIEVEGWTPDHDDEHTDGSLADAAASYAATRPGFTSRTEEIPSRGESIVSRTARVPRIWPKSWSIDWWKPKIRRRNLVKAGALIVAEIERLDRAAAKETANDRL